MELMQQVEIVYADTLCLLNNEIQLSVNKMNQREFLLTDIKVICEENNPRKYSSAILIYTKQ